jgi:hypothetical protein
LARRAAITKSEPELPLRGGTDNLAHINIGRLLVDINNFAGMAPESFTFTRCGDA